MDLARNNKRPLIYACVIGLLVSINLKKYGHWIAGLNVTDNVHVQNIFSNFVQPFTYISPFSFFVITYLSYKLICYICQMNKLQKIDKVTVVFNVIYSIVLGLAISFGNMSASGTVDLYFDSTLRTVVWLLNVVGIASISYLLIVALEQKIYLRPVSGDIKHIDESISWWKCFLFIIICWLPYVIILYPATMNPDTVNQLTEFFGHGNWVHDDFPIGWYLLKGHGYSISNQHNFFLTLLYGFNFKLGLNLFNSSSLGLFISSLEQLLCLNGVFTYSLVTFHRLKMPYAGIKKFALFYALFPMLPIIGMFLTKNVFYSICFIWSILLIVNKGEQHQSVTWKWWICFVLSIVGQLATEKYAIYIVVMTCILLLVLEWKDTDIKSLAIIMISISLIFVGGQHVLFAKLGVSNGDPIEGKSVMLQSTALYQIKYPHDITSDQKRVLNKVFVLKNLKYLYTPGISDPIKSSGRKKIGLQPDGLFNQHISKKWIEGYRYRTVTKKDMKQYNSVWLQLMMKHPKVLFQAFMEQGYGYLDVLYRQEDSSVVAPSNALNVGNITGIVPVKKKLIVVKAPRHFEKIRKIIVVIFSSLVKIPPFMVLLSGTILISVTIIEWLILLRLHLYRQSFLLLSFLMQVPIFMLSPVNGSQRYMYPFFLSSGVFGGLILVWLYEYKRNKQNNHKENEI